MGDDGNVKGDVAGKDHGWQLAFKGLKPALAMILVQVVLAGINVFYKLALNDGMDVKILVAYRYVFAAAFLCPLAFFFER